MTYWYEPADDPKDPWYWMGVVTTLVHDIGLHKNPEKSSIDHNKRKLYRRIWWSYFIRDHLVALGMRQPIRINDEDYNVPMLTEDDFELVALPESITIISQDCTLMRDFEAQRDLAQMCIAKAKLCLCMSRVLNTQRSMLVRHQGIRRQEGSTCSGTMLFLKKLDQADEVTHCEVELSKWIDDLPQSCIYSSDIAIGRSGASLFLHRSLLHMVYFATLSALHMPQLLSSNASTYPDKCHELQDLSRKKVIQASLEITRLSRDLHTQRLERHLPSTAVTVLLLAIITHLLSIKSCNDDARQAAMNGFNQCMLVLQELQDSYSSADFATQFLKTAIPRADLDTRCSSSRYKINHADVQATRSCSEVKELRERVGAVRRIPPPTNEESGNILVSGMMDAAASGDQIYNTVSAQTPPENELPFHNLGPMVVNENWNTTTGEMGVINGDVDLNDFLNSDGTNAEMWNAPLEGGTHGESVWFMGDLNWIDQSHGWVE
jgi:hypothetical protein